MGKRIPLEEALCRARANDYGRMLGRNRDNRLEPECWPHVEPTFHFTKDQSFFAIGSCFAQNIAKRLLLDGYKVHGGVVTNGNCRNRYTPVAIYQELAWAKAIFDRDDTVRDEDIRPLLLDLGKGHWTDVWSRPERGTSKTLEEAVADRRAFYAHFRGAFVSDVVVVTLGLIEAWWDEISQSYVEFDTPWTRREDRDRFQFERLSFESCKNYVARTLELLLDGKRRVLLTTSPVILARTFTDQDIIVANSHSKSVLRAVCGEVVDQFEAVDYFPSYEIATLTRRPEVWEDDLIHIQPDFIAQIMQHVTNAYVPGSVGNDERTLMRMANLVTALQFDAAQAIYDVAAQASWGSANPAVHVAAMRLASRRGDAGSAARHAMRVDAADERLFRNHPEWMFDIWRVLSGGYGEHRDAAAAIRRHLVQLGAELPERIHHIFIDRQRAGDEAALRDLAGLVREADVDHPNLMHKLCAEMARLGDTEAALALADRQLEKAPDHGLMLVRRARLLLLLGRLTEAIGPLRRLTELEPENGWAGLTLARTLGKLGRTSDALAAVDALLAGAAADAHAMALKARLLARLGRADEAIGTAQAAAAAANGDANVLRDVQPLIAKAAAG